ncbi:MAG: GNAT family N-acetyltransferase, partial [Duncaniella sp.]|nr:GNAT family N-acetyltransferase [Duncaniella sp.]
MTLNEITQLYQIRRLAKEEVVRSFDCGDEDLNDFILNESVRYRQARLAVSYVIEIKGTND